MTIWKRLDSNGCIYKLAEIDSNNRILLLVRKTENITVYSDCNLSFETPEDAETMTENLVNHFWTGNMIEWTQQTKKWIYEAGGY